MFSTRLVQKRLSVPNFFPLVPPLATERACPVVVVVVVVVVVAAAAVTIDCIVYPL
jgi:hypothetical protein